MWGECYSDSRHGAVGVAGLAVPSGIRVLPHHVLVLLIATGAFGHTHGTVLHIQTLQALMRPLGFTQGKAGSVINRWVETQGRHR